MGFIDLDYLDARRQWKKLEDAAEQCRDADRAASELLAEIDSYWSGEACEAFKEKIIAWKTENREIMKETLRIATLIRETADSIKDADERAAKAAKGE